MRAKERTPLKPEDQAPEDDPKAHKSGPTVVGIGASAGGLAALKKFFDQVPPDSGLAFVDIKKDQIYAIRLINNSPEEVGVAPGHAARDERARRRRARQRVRAGHLAEAVRVGDPAG